MMGMLTRGQDGRPLQPALKVRGREYLRLVYGIDYLDPPLLEQLKRRRVAPKRALAVFKASLAERLLLAFLHGAEESRLQYAAAFLGTERVRSEEIDRTL
jgi:hypothetical protein